ncbi:hypothetical protein ACJJTC_002564 [Scirpophaga incertulas]
MNMNQRFNRNYNNRGYRGRAGNNRGGFGRGNRGLWGQQNFRGSYPQGRGSFRRGNFTQDNPAQGYMKVEQWDKPKRDTPGKRLCESDIGVTEYISDHSGFNGIIKSRYSDFQVSEISKEGHEAILTDLKPPKPPVDVVDEDEELLLTKYNVEILPLETWDNINKIAVCQEETSETVEIDVTGMTKEQRTKIHEAVKKAFGSSVIGSTVSVDDKKYVRFEKYRKGVRVDTRVKWIWPGEYVYFVVYKENCDTMEAASLIAERLRMNLRPSTICFAGTKDRRAKTSQWMSMRRVQPASLARASAQLRALRLGNYKFLHEPLRLGMLSGNRSVLPARSAALTPHTYTHTYIHTPTSSCTSRCAWACSAATGQCCPPALRPSPRIHTHTHTYIHLQVPARAAAPGHAQRQPVSAARPLCGPHPAYIHTHIHTYTYKFLHEPLRLGMLSGNRSVLPARSAALTPHTYTHIHTYNYIVGELATIFG